MATLEAVLKLDEHSLINQFMYIEEHNNADGSFILSMIIKQQIERKLKIILVLCHHSLGHFHSISQKLGYNLFSLKESNEVYVIDILDKIKSESFLISEEPFKKLFMDIKNQVDLWQNEKGVCIIAENLGNLLLVNNKDYITLIGYLRAMALEHENSSFVLSIHTFPDSSDFSYVTKSIRYFADIIVLLEDLQTGWANDVTGHLTVSRREDRGKKVTLQYQYHLQDKSVSVFPPGSRSFLSFETGN